MESRLGRILTGARRGRPRTELARQLGLSYSFVRALEIGQRFPSDEVLADIARRIRVPEDELLLAAYCDRSPALAHVLASRGVTPTRAEGLPRTG